VDWRTLAAKHDIPYRGLPDIDSSTQYELDDVPTLLEYLRSKYYLNKEVAANYLGSIANRGRQRRHVEEEQTRETLDPAVNELKPLLRDEPPRVQRAAADALAELYPYFPDRIPQSVLDARSSNESCSIMDSGQLMAKVSTPRSTVDELLPGCTIPCEPPSDFVLTEHRGESLAVHGGNESNMIHSQPLDNDPSWSQSLQ